MTNKPSLILTVSVIFFVSSSHASNTSKSIEAKTAMPVLSLQKTLPQANVKNHLRSEALQKIQTNFKHLSQTEERAALVLKEKKIFKKALRLQPIFIDTLPNNDERCWGGCRVEQEDGSFAADFDCDGLLNWQEEICETSICNEDSDGDGSLDSFEVVFVDEQMCIGEGCSSGNTLAHCQIIHGDPNNTDTDGDGINDGDEVSIHETNPLSEDSDNDGVNDSDEIFVHQTDPNDSDTDDDGMIDGDEINMGNDPLTPDNQTSAEEGALFSASEEGSNISMSNQDGLDTFNSNNASVEAGNKACQSSSPSLLMLIFIWVIAIKARSKQSNL